MRRVKVAITQRGPYTHISCRSYATRNKVMALMREADVLVVAEGEGAAPGHEPDFWHGLAPSVHGRHFGVITAEQVAKILGDQFELIIDEEGA